MIDLHTHSTFSDGTFTPAQLISSAQAIRLRAIALTDHDTIEGIPVLQAAAENSGVEVIPGVEISVDVKLRNKGHMHILGLLIDPSHAELKETLTFLSRERALRGDRIVESLQRLGMDVSRQELQEEAGEGAIGRPHIARILLRKGYVRDIQDAFDRFLGKGCPGYVDKKKLNEADAIRLIHNAGGLAILAHPQYMNFATFAETREKILQLKMLGLDGVEVFYSGMPNDFQKALQSLAIEENLVVSGGSDFHGENKPGISLGSGRDNDLNIPLEILEALKQRKAERHLC